MGLLDAVKVLARARRDDEARYLLAERVARRIHPQAILSERGRTWLDDRDLLEIYERFQGGRNLRRLDRVWVLDQVAAAAVHVDGDTAECGVWRGLSSYVICRRIAGSAKLHHGFDSFAGLSAPSSSDGAYWSAGDLAVSEIDARRALEAFPFARLHAGWIPEKFPEVADRRFALVHVDVDLATPTRDSIEFFWPRLSPGGFMVFDDYGFTTCPGARQAIDEYFPSAHDVTAFLHLPTGQALAMKGGST